MVQVLGPVAYGNPGSVPLTVTVAHATAPSADIIINWEASCSTDAEGYGIYEGVIGAWYSHTLLDCDDDGSDFSEQITPAAGNTYYLVVPHSAVAEGSYGRCSPGVCGAGDERPVGVAQCVAPQSLPTCP